MRLVAILLILGLSAPATAQLNGPRQPRQPIAGERLAQNIHADFIIGARENRGGHFIEDRIPLGETVGQWTKRIRVERYSSHAQRESAADHLEAMRASLSRTCPDAAVQPLTPLTISGHQAVRFRVDCPLSLPSRRPETVFVVGVDGRESLHIAQIAFRRAPTVQDVAWAERQIESMMICQSGDPHPVCLQR